MSIINKKTDFLQKWTRGLLPVFLILFFYSIEIVAKPFVIKTKSLEHCVLRYSAKYQKRIGIIEKKLTNGFNRLYIFTGKPALKKLPQFWFLANDSEMENVLAGKFFNLNKAARKKAIKRGSYRNMQHIVIQIGPGLIDDWLLRIIFTEYARNLLDAIAPARVGRRMGWLYSGLSTYLGWFVHAEITNQSREMYEEFLIQYYGRHFNTGKFLPLELLGSPVEWQGALERESAGVYSQAVLIYLFLARTRGRRIGLLILRNYNREKSFHTAFERATKMKLADFEQKLIGEFYPTINRRFQKK